MGSGLFDEYVLTDEAFGSQGPVIVDIVVHAEGTNFTPQFTYDLILPFKFKSGKWKDATPPLLVLQTTGDYVIGTPFNISAAVRLYTGC